MSNINEHGHWRYEILKDQDGKYVEIVRYTGKDSIVEIPAKMGSFFKYPVKAIRNGAFYDEKVEFSLKKIIIPSGVIRLGQPYEEAYSKVLNPLLGMLNHNDHTRFSAKIRELENNKGVFACCDGLEEVILPDTCEYIGHTAFSGTYSLKTLNLPDSVTEFAKQAFHVCGLESFSFPPKVVKVTKFLFDRSEYLKEVHLHDGITEVESGAFSGCKKLQTINIPESVKSVGTHAFAKCCELKEIRVPATTQIQYNAFAECPAEIIKI